MPPYNPRIHHRRSIRLKGYDYSQAGLYFITICCYDRQCLFGKITDGEMNLNDGGKMANECWMGIPDHFPNAVLHEHIIMPNHVHGIIELKTDDIVDVSNTGVENFQPLSRITPLPPVKRNEFQKIIPRSIGSIIRGYKIGVTKWFRSYTDVKTVWQRNFHERIIRNEQSYQRIAQYIINNPVKWQQDSFCRK